MKKLFYFRSAYCSGDVNYQGVQLRWNYGANRVEDEDHLFLPSIKNIVYIHKTSDLLVLQNCGQVVKVDHSEFFNIDSITFISELE